MRLLPACKVYFDDLVEEEEKDPANLDVIEQSVSESISASASNRISSSEYDNDGSDKHQVKKRTKVNKNNDASCVPSSNQRNFSQVYSKFELKKYQERPNLT